MFHWRTFKRFYKLWQTKSHGCCFPLSRMEMAILTSRSWMLSWRTSMRRTIRWDKKAQKWYSVSKWQIMNAILLYCACVSPQEVDTKSLTGYKQSIMALSDGGKLYRSELEIVLCREPMLWIEASWPPSQLCSSCLNTVTVCMCRAPPSSSHPPL